MPVKRSGRRRRDVGDQRKPTTGPCYCEKCHVCPPPVSSSAINPCILTVSDSGQTALSPTRTVRIDWGPSSRAPWRERSRRMSRFPVPFAFVLALSAAAVAVAPAAAVMATPLGVNLVQNPSAEDGLGIPDGSRGVDIPGWETISGSNFTVVPYGAPGGFPATTDAPPKAGQEFFAAGKEHSGECDNAIQPIMITGRNAVIDSHHVQVTLSAWVATFGNQVDNAIVRLKFGDQSNNSLGSIKLPTQTATNDTFHHLTKKVLLPRHTREMTVVLESTNHIGYCDAYFDKVSVKLAKV